MPVEPRSRFDNFVVGSANRLAVAAARAVADNPGSVYNPLFIYSGSGLGKTHLMCAIANQVAQRRPDQTIELVTLDDFVESLHASIQAGSVEPFKQRYLRVGLLLLDDVQFLTGYPETQTELLRIFNALQAEGRQIVMTSDRPPAEIPDVDERLLTRLAGGLIVDIGPPDYETRMAILLARCAERGVRFNPGVVEELCRLEFANVRELQGALNRLIAFQTLGGHQLESSDVLKVVGDLAESRARRPAPPSASGEFQSFLTEVASAVALHVDQWKTHIADAIDYWTSEGYRTAWLDRVLRAPAPPASVESLLRDFDARVSRLRDLAAEVTRLDPSLASDPAFLDPERVADAEAILDRARRASAPPPGPSTAFTRAGYAVGTSNQLAVRAADAIVSAPGSRYNPLFLHGPSGVGKTHLLHAIGNGLADVIAGPVACVPAQMFVDELIAALQEGTVDRWRSRYRGSTALLLDDVQFVAGKERTQEELFHVFNFLHGEGKQIVLASDRPPRELTGLEERLRSRFEGGLVVELQSPDRALRERLYERFLADAGAATTPELLSFLAERPAANVREIIGTVNRLVAAAEVAAVPITPAMARAELAPTDTAVRHGAALQAAADPFFLDEEKVVWDWSDATARLIEELR